MIDIAFVLGILGSLASIYSFLLTIVDFWGNNERGKARTSFLISILLIFATFGSFFFWSKHNANIDKDETLESKEILRKVDKPDWVKKDSFTLEGFESKKQILDGNLFVGKDFDKFLIGGANVEMISIAFRNEDGEKIKVVKNVEDGELSTYLFEDKYIEISYKDYLFIIQQIPEYNLPARTMSYNYEIYPAEALTMSLKTFKDFEEGRL
ncbi:hypothetical protein [Arcticibacterium luteifluviistationis]|uniref:Uncharacterized protein n=1 Tax=Arcticibacterium luteifluviistationis TaxID=1784714 RepID=A0A2Z4GGY2_9BACT|nr:hypothetical protein [Arcticibacterium luteifluviistationis]AWW00551.1 hypothetical protein DJ013_21135 [Arcticibacterium luteifluviistationis]